MSPFFVDFFVLLLYKKQCIIRGNELVIRPAVESMIAEAEEVALGSKEYYTYDDIFTSED